MKHPIDLVRELSMSTCIINDFVVVYPSIPQMKIEEMTKSDFLDLLRELFAEGITKERIVVLFFFCSDVAINALRGPENLFSQFFNWSLDFVTGYICSWVRQNGGWVC